MNDSTQTTEAPRSATSRPVPGSHSSKVRSEPLGPMRHPLSDVDGSLPTLPARGPQDHAVFAIVSLALEIAPDACGRGEHGPRPGHDIEARCQEVQVDLEPIRKRIADELDVLLRSMNHRADFNVKLSVRFEPPPTTPFWRDFE